LAKPQLPTPLCPAVSDLKATSELRSTTRCDKVNARVHKRTYFDTSAAALRARIKEKVLGPEHPDTNRALCNLPRLLITFCRAREALGPPQPRSAPTKRFSAPTIAGPRTASVTADALDVLGRADQAAAVRARYLVERYRDNE
jgi:hypothetical protein